MSHKKLSKPAAWKNTYFWIAGLLLVISLYGLLAREETIRDPGQKVESGLIWFYFAAAILMVVNGILSHRQTVRHYEETVGPVTAVPARTEATVVARPEPDSTSATTEETKELHG